jgi:predicted MFS family arabinose efflux permease
VRFPFYYGWVVVAVATFAMFAATLTGGAGFSVFIAPMSRDLGWSRSVLAGALSAGTIVGALVAPVLGRLIDAYGARAVLTLCGAGIALTLTVVSGVTSELAFVIAYGAARAIDMGALNLAVSTAVANWFVRMRGRALGIAMTGNAIGVMLLVPAIQWMIDGPGWRPAWLIVGGGSGLILCVGSALLVRRRPEDIGLRPDGDAEPPGPTDATGAGPMARAEADWTARRAASSSAFWLLVLASCGSQMAVSGLTTHQAAILAENGLSAMAVAGAIGLYGLAWTVSALVWGVLIERLSARVVLAILSLLVAGCCLGALATRDPLMLVAYVLVYGTANGAKEALDSVVWSDYFGRRAAGAIRGLSRPFVIGSGALGSFAGGVGYDLTGSYTVVVVALAAISLLGVAASVLATPPREPVVAPV